MFIFGIVSKIDCDEVGVFSKTSKVNVLIVSDGTSSGDIVEINVSEEVSSNPEAAVAVG